MNLLTLMRTGVKEKVRKARVNTKEKPSLISQMRTLKPIGVSQANPLKAKANGKERIKERTNPARVRTTEKDIPRARKTLPPVRIRHQVKPNHPNGPGRKSPGTPEIGLRLTGQEQNGNQDF